jgi:hypothetical protein
MAAMLLTHDFIFFFQMRADVVWCHVIWGWTIDGRFHAV